MMWSVSTAQRQPNGGLDVNQEVIRKRIAISDEVRAPTAKTPQYGLALATVLILSAFLNLFQLTSAGYG